MSDDFSFRSLVPAGSGARQALEQTLRVERARELARKPTDWIYGGPADFLLTHGQWFGGRDLPERWDHVRGQAGHCHHNSLDAAETEPELRYFTGMYMVGQAARPHSWCVDSDGLVCELTFPDQRLIDASGGLAGSLLDDSGRESGIPWLPPATWAYIGVEYDPAFIRRHSELRMLPVLDPFGERTTPFGLACYLRDEPIPVWRTPYTMSGFPVTDAPQEIKDGFAEIYRP